MIGPQRKTRRILLSACVTGALLLVVYRHPVKAQDDDLARELPRIKPLEPAAALESFRMHAGLSARAGRRRSRW